MMGGDEHRAGADRHASALSRGMRRRWADAAPADSAAVAAWPLTPAQPLCGVDAAGRSRRQVHEEALIIRWPCGEAVIITASALWRLA